MKAEELKEKKAEKPKMEKEEEKNEKHEEKIVPIEKDEKTVEQLREETRLILQTAVEQIQSLKKEHITELKSFANPPSDEQVSKIIESQPDFQPEILSKYSYVVKFLCVLVKAIINYHQIRKKFNSLEKKAPAEKEEVKADDFKEKKPEKPKLEKEEEKNENPEVPIIEKHDTKVEPISDEARPILDAALAQINGLDKKLGNFFFVGYQLEKN